MRRRPDIDYTDPCLPACCPLFLPAWVASHLTSVDQEEESEEGQSGLIRTGYTRLPSLRLQPPRFFVTMADLGAESVVSVEYRGRVAVITIDNDKKLNALGQLQYYALARAMQEVAKHDEVFVTVILAKGRYFSA